MIFKKYEILFFYKIYHGIHAQMLIPAILGVVTW